MLRSKFFSTEQVEAIVRDFHSAGLPQADVAMLDYAVKVSDHAYKVTPRDLEGLRAQEFTDEAIIDIAAAAAVRHFISKMVDALGADLDEAQYELEPQLREALDVGGRLR